MKWMNGSWMKQQLRTQYKKIASIKTNKSILVNEDIKVTDFWDYLNVSPYHVFLNFTQS